MSRRHSEDEPVVWRGGVQVAGTVLWCDAARARGLCFLSSAVVAAATPAAHRQVLATARTIALGRALAPSVVTSRWTPLVTPFGRPFSLGRLRLELFPSGRLPGAAAIVVETGGRRVLYAGEVQPHPGPLVEPCEVRGADVVVAAAPLAPLARSLPPRADALAAVVAAVRRALAEQRTPVVLVPALGVAAVEVMGALAAAGLPARAHRRIAAAATALGALGLAVPAPLPTGDGPLLRPLERAAAPARWRERPHRTVAVTGLALAPGAAARLGVDEAVPLADHADLDSLLDWVTATGARDLFLTAGWDEAVARAFAARGVRARRLGPPQQLDLSGFGQRARPPL